MNNYRFILEIPANSEQEAKAKLDLMLQLASFCKDFNTADLAGSFLNYFVWNRLGKFLANPNSSSQRQPVAETATKTETL